MVGCFLSQFLAVKKAPALFTANLESFSGYLKPSELYILCCENGFGLDPFHIKECRILRASSCT